MTTKTTKKKKLKRNMTPAERYEDLAAKIEADVAKFPAMRGELLELVARLRGPRQREATKARARAVELAWKAMKRAVRLAVKVKSGDRCALQARADVSLRLSRSSSSAAASSER